jgi:hypothetical protein
LRVSAELQQEEDERHDDGNCARDTGDVRGLFKCHGFFPGGVVFNNCFMTGLFW